MLILKIKAMFELTSITASHRGFYVTVERVVAKRSCLY